MDAVAATTFSGPRVSRRPGVQKKRPRTVVVPGRRNVRSLGYCSAGAFRSGLVASATASAVTAATSAATAASAAASAIFARASFVDRQGATVVLLAVQRADGGLRFVITTHFHKAESLTATAFTVRNHLRALHAAVGREHLFQIRTTDSVAQIPHIQFLTQR
jgi:hypothetical protein